MHWRMAIILCLIAQSAQAERIRDMSLTPEETMREPDIVNPQSTQQYLQPQYGTAAPSNVRYNDGGVPQRTFFMDEYCNPSIKPIIQSNALRGIVECMDSVKQRACDSFAKLPDEAKTLVDNTVRCVYEAAESGTGASYDVQCRQPLAEQHWLLKKYWSDNATAYTILFLPDMLVDSASFCRKGSQ